MNNLYRVCLFFAFMLLICWPLDAQWVKCTPVPGDHSVFSGQLQHLAVNGTRLFATRSSIVDSIFYTDDNGSTWNVSKLPGVVLGGSTFYPSVAGVWTNDGTVFASGGPDGKKTVLWRSADNGHTWDSSSTGFISSESNRTPVVFYSHGSTFYAGSGGGGVYVSTNSGVTWTPARTGIPKVSFAGFTSYVNILSVAAIGNDIFVGLGGDISAHGFGLRHTTLGSTTWDSLGTGLPASSLIYSLISMGTTLYARVGSFSAGAGLYKSTDLGATWTNTTNSLPNRNNLDANCQGFYAVGSTLFADTFMGDYVSTDGGGTWTAMNNTGLPATYYINGYAVVGNTMFITVGDVTTFPATTAIWKRAISEITAVHEISSMVPKAFSLQQNFPNPFNPTTEIKFQVPEAGFVSLKVIDILGRDVATLVDRELHPGTYSVAWDGKQAVSGTYFYMLKTKDYSEIRKMALIK